MQLVIESQCFIDPHSDVDFGGNRAFVTQADFSEKLMKKSVRCSVDF